MFRLSWEKRAVSRRGHVSEVSDAGPVLLRTIDHRQISGEIAPRHGFKKRPRIGASARDRRPNGPKKARRMFLAAGIALVCVAFASAADTGCTGRGGVCQTDSLACRGSYASGLCDGAANRRCCLPAGVSSGGCPLSTFSYAGTRFADAYGSSSSCRVHPDFLPKMRDMNSYAAACGVKIMVTSHYRKVPVTGNQWNAQRSCHMIGHAIDMNIQTDAGKFCNADCLKNYASLTQNDGIACFLKKIKSHPTLHWGIDFNDPVHIDDRVCTSAAAFDSKIFTLGSC